MVITEKDIALDRSGYILGLDPPASRDLGWALCHYDHDARWLSYVDSGGFDIDGTKDEAARCLNLRNFLQSLHNQHDPIILYCIERAIGRGFDVARELLGENTGIIKLTAYENGSKVVSINTNHMFKVLDIPTKKKVDRQEKKVLTCKKVKDMFPEQLEDRKPSKSGKFTHEADALGFIVSFCIDKDIEIEGNGNNDR